MNNPRTLSLKYIIGTIFSPVNIDSDDLNILPFKRIKVVLVHDSGARECGVLCKSSAYIK